MIFTRSTTVKFLKLSVPVILAVIIIAYAMWRSLNYTRGPEISVFEPENGSTISSTTVVIRGQAQRINDLKLNGNSISVDEKGNFLETIIVFPGLNRINMTAHDQFGRLTEQELTILGRPQ